MKYKKILLIIGIIVIIGLVFIITKMNKKYDAFYLDNNYYGEGKFIESDYLSINKLLGDKKTFVLFTYNNYCNLPVSCENIFQQVIENLNISIIHITFEEFKKTSLYSTVKYAPSVIIIKEGKIVDYLKADDDKDLKKYQDVNAFEKWLRKYIVFNN